MTGNAKARHAASEESPGPMSSAAELVRLGERYYALNALADAERLFKDALAIEAGNVDALNNLGVLCFSRDAFAEAESYFHAALQADPRRSEARSNLDGLYAAHPELVAASRLDARVHGDTEYPKADIRKIIGEHWSGETVKELRNEQLKLRWWKSPPVLKHINKVVCGESIPGLSEGLIQLVRSRFKNLIPFNKAISVGSGRGHKEMNLLRQGMVNTFELYEFSEERIKIGRKLAGELCLEDRVRFINGDAFELVTEADQYDLVHWDNALHHMFDVDKAVAWSKKILKPGGLFYMDDFIGPSRFQWPDEQLELATRVRRVFSQSRYLVNPRTGDSLLPTTIKRPDAERLIADDPSEAADSGRIIEAITRHFPDAEIKPTGGIVYHLVMNDMIDNFHETDDRILLDLLMIIDELAAKTGQSHYAVALAVKPG